MAASKSRTASRTRAAPLALPPISPDMKPRHVKGAFTQVLDGEVTVYEDRSDKVHILNASASVIWQLCDGDRTVQQVIEDVAAVYEKSEGELSETVTRLIADLVSQRLIEVGR